MFFISVFVLSLSLGTGYGFNCRHLTGTWQNQLGSNMTITHLSNTEFTGEYHTAVETKQRAALTTSNITGQFMPTYDGALLSFTVLFNHGKSLTTWVGQCMVCDGEEILFTSWVLKSHALKPSDKWMANIINEDTFKRVPDDNINSLIRPVGPLPNEVRSPVCEKNLKAGANGQWLSTSGDALKFSACHKNGVFSGMNHGAPFIGRKDGGGLFTALGFSTVSLDSIKGWTGHIYESSLERLRTIETSWLSHTFSNTCQDPRASVQYGMSNYTFVYGQSETVEKPRWREYAFNYIRSFF